MTPFDMAVADRQQARAFHAAIDDIQQDREAFAREESLALTPRERYRRHFDACNGTRDPQWIRLSWYRQALLQLEQCRNVRALAGSPGLSRKTAHFLWERNFETAQIARKVLAYELKERAVMQ